LAIRHVKLIAYLGPTIQCGLAGTLILALVSSDGNLEMTTFLKKSMPKWNHHCAYRTLTKAMKEGKSRGFIIAPVKIDAPLNVDREFRPVNCSTSM
jgi:hypothetical protein